MQVLAKAKDIQRNTAEYTTVSIKLALLEDLIAEIERLQGVEEQLGKRNRPFEPKEVKP